MIASFSELVLRTVELTDEYLQILKTKGDREADDKHLAFCEYVNSYRLQVKDSLKVGVFKLAYDILVDIRAKLLAGHLDVYILRDKVKKPATV